METLTVVLLVGLIILAPLFLFKMRAPQKPELNTHWIVEQEKEIWGESFTKCECDACDHHRWVATSPLFAGAREDERGRPPGVPHYANVRQQSDGTGFGYLLYYTWTDPETGKPMGATEARVKPLRVAPPEFDYSRRAVPRF